MHSMKENHLQRSIESGIVGGFQNLGKSNSSVKFLKRGDLCQLKAGRYCGQCIGYQNLSGTHFFVSARAVILKES